MSRPEHRTDHIVVADPDAAWPDAFHRLRDGILPAFDGMPVSIEHIGSTSVAGLSAKPIIDMVIVVPGMADIPAAIERLRTIGYEHEGDLGVTGREAFRGGLDGPAHHLYVSAARSTSLAAQIAFRDALRADPRLAAEYGELKRRLAATFRDDRAAYTDAKSAFVARVLRATAMVP